MTTLAATSQFLVKVDQRFINIIFALWKTLVSEKPRKAPGRHRKTEEKKESSGQIYFWLIVTPVIAWMIYYTYQVLAIIQILS